MRLKRLDEEEEEQTADKEFQVWLPLRSVLHVIFCHTSTDNGTVGDCQDPKLGQTVFSSGRDELSIVFVMLMSNLVCLWESKTSEEAAIESPFLISILSESPSCASSCIWTDLLGLILDTHEEVKTGREFCLVLFLCTDNFS